MIVELFRKNSSEGDCEHTFFKKKSPGPFRFGTLPLEILDKERLSLPLEIL